MSTVYFQKQIEFPDDSVEDIDFEANIVESGFNYTYGNEKNFKKELEITNISFYDEHLTPEQKEFVQEMADNGDFDDDIYNNYGEEKDWQ